MTMNFKSYEDFYSDIAAWERQLPEFDAVCGVPRSGLIPAAYIALRRNIRLVAISDLLNKPEGAISRAPLRNNNPKLRFKTSYGNRLLIVDDSSSDQSVTFSRLRNLLEDQQYLEISYGAVYRASSQSKVDHYYQELPQPRMFGWNWHRHWGLQSALLDMDGVICEDWAGPPEQAEDEDFVRHVESAKPLYLPEVPVLGIVTSRIERYRQQTAAWLARHGVRYRHLVMHPASTPEERRQMRDHAERKGWALRDSPRATMFVESDIRQARTIAQMNTGKPVLCTDTMEVLN